MARVDTSGVAGDVRGRIQRTEAYAEQVRKMFAAVVNAILTLKVTPPDIANGEMYSFDGQSIRIRQQVEQLLRQLHSVVVLAIEKGISLEWDKAQEASNDLLKRVYGSRLLNSNVMRGWNSRNNAAQEEFIKRSDRGMNLSQRVWKSCRQLRDEMEVALTVSIGEGEDAGTISRRVRQYLNDPDLMFRRFRYKIKEPLRDDKGNYILDKNGQIQMVDKLDSAGNPIWGRKWKKKVIDHATGKVTFIDYDKDSYHDQWTGKGYYKSAAQNAMRVARTETNIAYRRSDCERWKQLDFVLGIRVELSHNHPEYDICDELKGDYPKDFVFDGWHPQCFCHAVPILIDPSEMRKRNDAIANGEEYTPKGTPVTDVPQGFKDWCIENEEKIYNARNRGTEPYFVKNNYDNYVGRILYPAYYEEQDRLRAEQEAQLKKLLHVKNIAGNVVGVAKGKFGDFSIDTSKLDAALATEDHDLIKSETKTLAKSLSDLQKKIKEDAQKAIVEASKYKDFEGSSEITALADMAKKSNVSAINTQTLNLQAQVDELKAKLGALTNLYNVQDWAEEFTLHELELADNAVAATIASKAGLGNKALQAKLEFEADWVKNHPKYSTSKVVQQAYENKAKEVAELIFWDDTVDKLNEQKLYYALHTKSTNLKKHLDSLEDAIATKDKTKAEQAIKDFESHKAKLESAAAARKAKKPAVAGIDITESKPKEVALVVQTEKQFGHQSWGAYYEDDPEEAMDVVLSRTNILDETIKLFASTSAGKAFDRADLDILTLSSTIKELEKECNNLESDYKKKGKDKEFALLKLTIQAIKEECRMQARAVGNFSWQWDYEIRQVQCGNSVTSRHGHTAEQILERAQSLERFLRCSPRWDGGKTYRGMTLSEKELKNIINECKAGTCSMLGSASWSTSKSTAQGFSSYHKGETSPLFGDTKNKCVVFVTDTHKIGTSITHLSKFRDGEGEVLCSMIERFTFIRMEEVGGYTYVYVRPT